MSQAARLTVTPEEYLALEDSSPDRHEYLAGEVFAMGGGTHAHDAVSLAVAAELRTALRGRDCSAAGPNLRLLAPRSGLYTYADALVVCAPRFADEKRTTLLNPRVVVEVISESTEAYDRGEKFAHYRSIESVADYVLCSAIEPLVEVYSRGDDDAWTLRVYGETEHVSLPSVSVRLAVSAIYAGVELDPPRARGAR